MLKPNHLAACATLAAFTLTVGVATSAEEQFRAGAAQECVKPGGGEQLAEKAVALLRGLHQ
ncbi:hypothetical protein AMJ85_08030 [candidate division BRC1 bacterium SM23_51]|nr:MAG: hypothetical protein AMJ85_08030 [candidate division BRC1 bacterium SM23_51]